MTKCIKKKKQDSYERLIKSGHLIKKLEQLVNLNRAINEIAKVDSAKWRVFDRVRETTNRVRTGGGRGEGGEREREREREIRGN